MPRSTLMKCGLTLSSSVWPKRSRSAVVDTRASFLAEIGEEQDERASLSAVPMRSRGRTLALENVISTTFGREPHCPGLDLRAVGRSSGGSLAAGEEIPGSEGQEELHAIAGRWQ